MDPALSFFFFSFFPSLVCSKSWILRPLARSLACSLGRMAQEKAAQRKNIYFFTLFPIVWGFGSSARKAVRAV